MPAQTLTSQLWNQSCSSIPQSQQVLFQQNMQQLSKQGSSQPVNNLDVFHFIKLSWSSKIKGMETLNVQVADLPALLHTTSKSSKATKPSGDSKVSTPISAGFNLTAVKIIKIITMEN